ncbi:hypothetical protein IWQ57_004121, partial [Coemansia nantahalensis]
GIRAAFRDLKPLVDATSGFPENKKWNEREMYSCLQALFLFVAYHVKHGLSDICHRIRVQLILPYAEVDANPWHADDDNRPDLGLAVRWLESNDDVACIPGKADYEDAFAILEAKGERESSRSGSESTLDTATKDAFAQVVDYTRQLYAEQIDRRYAWGLTQCCAKTRACLLVNNGMVATHAMDLRTEDGRRELVRLIVDWSLGEFHQLGFDPSIRRLHDLGCWEIEVPRLRNTGGGDTGGGAAGGDTVLYYFAKSLVRADRLRGRHTRCFAATLVKPTAEVTKDNPLIPQVVIKDAWSYVEHRDGGMDEGHEPREITFHHMIREAPPDKRSHLPQFQNGGAVRMTTGNVSAADTTDAILGPLRDELPGGLDSRKCRYEHVRMATKLVTHLLQEATSVYELIVVVNDAVKAVGALHDIGILHRDVSVNNIMFARGQDDEPCGVLIDLDSALLTDDASLGSNRICTGTAPFMSVNNLERLPKQKSPAGKEGSENAVPALVDELESFLYVLIWHGVWGATPEHREQTLGQRPKVVAWLNPLSAENKRDKMSSKVNLGTLTGEFYNASNYETVASNADRTKNTKWVQDSYVFLKRLVWDLRDILFDNPG